MNFAAQQRNPAKHLTGIFFVILFHIVLGYALVNGLGMKVLEVIQKPLETTIIQEVKVQPPPEVKVVPPPKFDVPPPPFMPAPEVQIQAAPVQNTIAVATNTRPAETPSIRQASAVAAPPPSVTRVDLICTNYSAVQNEAGQRYYKALDRDSSLKGDVQIELTVAATGDVKDIVVTKTSGQTLTRIVMAAAQQLKCSGQSKEIRAMASFSFKQE